MLFSAAISASMQQLLAVMQGPGASGILPPEKGLWYIFLFLSLVQFLVFPEGDFFNPDLTPPLQRRLPPTLLSSLLS